MIAALAALGSLDQLLQSRFRSSCGVGVDKIPVPRPIKPLGRHLVSRLGRLDVASSHGLTYLSQLSTEGRLNRTIAVATGYVLTKSLLGTEGIRHGLSL